MASFNRALLRVKQDLDRFLPPSSIVDAATAAGHRWRKRLLDPVLTVQLFVLQVLNFNTSLTHLTLLAGRHHGPRKGTSIKPSAFCQARARLPLAVMQKLLRSMCDAAGAKGLFHGHKLWIVDGSSASLPDTPALQKTYPQPAVQRIGCGFPLLKVLALFDAATGLLVEMAPTSLHAHEQSRVWQMHDRLSAGDVLLGDRGFCSYWHVAMLAARQVRCIFRLHHYQIVVPDMKVMKLDLKVAGIEYGDEEMGFADLHAQRMTLNTMLASQSVDSRVRQSQLRHTDPKLTEVMYFDKALFIKPQADKLAMAEAIPLSPLTPADQTKGSATARIVTQTNAQ